AVTSKDPVMVATPPAVAETAQKQQEVPQNSVPNELAEVAITGTRIVRDGYEAPTPVSVLGVEDLNAMAVTNVSEAVNRLPALSGSLTSRTSATSVSSGTAGINNMSLRG